MANKRQRKKNGRSYEGQQYRGGRVKGRKNLVKTATGVINQHGVEFTTEEKKALERAVNNANRKRAKMLQQEAQLPRKVYGVLTGDTVHSLQLMGRESDFILTRKSKSLQRFQSREEYESYMRNLKRVNSKDYITERIRLYKRNHIKAIMDEFGEEGKGVAMKIRMMKPMDYMKMVMSEDEALEIRFVYGPDAKRGKLNKLRGALGMKLLEDEIPEALE